MLIMMVFFISSMLIMPFSAAESEIGNTDLETDSSDILDVFVIDLPCNINATCEPSRPEHMIEYFGADWCEPCESLELLLDTLDFEKIALIQHHPSVLDQSYLNYSKNKFDNTYRLLFIPSLVINSNSLLTGVTQGMELNQSLTQMDNNFSGIDNLSISNGMVYWNTTINYNLTIWKLESVKHELDNRTLPYLAVDKMVIPNSSREQNISMWLNDSTSRLIFVLQEDRVQPLQSLSTSPTGEKDLNDESNEDYDLLAYDGGYDIALITFIGLFLCLMPALIWFRKLQKQDSDESE